ncbi:PREDICTED: zinc finger matrin-type protein 5 isoform X2 [Vollenhovia emeryi]|nr:PREDICTED: zinc finger matrin-type protein 5 isoform X2 [Vollenhovia emeryi]
MQHVANRESHYSAYKDPETVLREEERKTSCKRFMTGGECAFGLGCRFSHFTPEMMWQLKQIVAMERLKGSTEAPKGGWPNAEHVTMEFLEHRIASSDVEDISPIWCPSPAIGRSHLPPSLESLTLEKITRCTFCKWGDATCTRC